MRTRTVEMFVGIYEGDAKTWYERDVEIPASTPADQLEAVALRVLAKELEDTEDCVAFYGVMKGWTTKEAPTARYAMAGR